MAKSYGPTALGFTLSPMGQGTWENSETIEEKLKTGKKTKTNKKEFKVSNWDWDVE